MKESNIYFQSILLQLVYSDSLLELRNQALLYTTIM